MTIHQLSVFVENKSGTLLQVLELLKEAHIQLIASTISDTVEYGIYRIICSEPLCLRGTEGCGHFSQRIRSVCHQSG